MASWATLCLFMLGIHLAYSACPSGWVTVGTGNNRTCYRLFSGQRKTFLQAQAFCQAQGGYSARDLSNVTHSELQKRISAAALSATHPADFWIGLNDNNKNNGPWLWIGGPNLGNYKQFATRYNNTAGKRDCFFVNTAEANMKWHMTNNCGATKAVVCQRDFNAPAPSAATTTPAPVFCPPNYIASQDLKTCIALFDDPKTWVVARQACQQNRGDFVKIDSPEMNEFVKGQIAAQKGVYWIGLHDRAAEGDFVWGDGTVKANYTNWNAHEPNHGGAENCVVADGNKDSKWADVDCTKQYRYICQITPFGVRPTGMSWSRRPWGRTAPPSVNCGRGWEDDPNTDNCYKFHDDLLTWTDARSVCQAEGGDLASVQHVQEQFYLSARTVSYPNSDFFWLGANDRATEKGWEWADGTPFAFFNWDANQPDNAHNADCVVMVRESGLWDDLPCQSRYGYICEKKGQNTFTPLPTTTPPNVIPSGQVWGCPSGWNNYRGSCYKVVENYIGIDQSKAHSLCSNAVNQGTLLSVVDQGENDYVNSMLPQNLTDYAWIGFQDKVENSFKWIDDTPVTFTNWRAGEPNNQNNEDCVGITKGGSWVDLDCDRPLQAFVCKRPKSLLTRNVEGGCEDGSVGFGAQCYTFIQDLKNFNDAQKDCRTRSQNKGNLATVDNSMLQGLLAAELDYRPGPTYWIGTRQSNYVYYWQSRATFSFAFFGRNHTGSERNTCVAMQKVTPVGMWANEDCAATMPYICEAPRPGYTTPTTRATQPVYGGCPRGWSTYSASCYMEFKMENASDTLSWPDARAFCKSQAIGGTLLSIPDQNTEQWIITHMLGGVNASGVYWIGLNDRDQEAGYEWQDGTPLLYAKWNANQPDDRNNQEDCVTWTLPNNTWNDEYCYISYSWICEMPRGSTLITTKAPVTGAVNSYACGNETWVSYNNDCYFFSANDGDMSVANWYDARDICRSMGAELASIHNADENGMITSYISKRLAPSFWIGFNDLDLKSYKWLDMSPVYYVNWNTNEPNDNYGGERCVEMTKGGVWNDFHCMEERGYVCKKYPQGYTPYIPSPTKTVGGCPTNFQTLPYLDYCYSVGGVTNSTMLSIDDANAACRQSSSQLASIHYSLEQKFITTLLAPIGWGGAWIGLNDRRIRNQFSWVDNTNADFSMWGPNQPDENLASDDPNDRRDCVMMSASTDQAGLWDDDTCDAKRAYVCQIRKSPSLPTSPPNTAGCKNGYQKFRNSCYKYNNEPYTWDQAEGSCQSEGGHLVSLSDGFEQAFVELVTSETDYIQMWIGLKYDDLVTSAFQWADGWPVTYTNWASDQPETPKSQKCVTHTVNGQWQTLPCTMTMNFFCEMNLETVPPQTENQAGACPDKNWFSYGSNCYLVEVDNPKAWPSASFACQIAGAQLVSIHTDGEAQFVTNLMGSEVGADMWIGLQKGQGDGFSWNDGTEVEYLYWSVGEPSDPDSQLHQDCVKARIADGAWADTDCFDLNPYMCKTPKVAGGTTMSPNNNNNNNTPRNNNNNTPNNNNNRTPNNNNNNPPNNNNNPPNNNNNNPPNNNNNPPNNNIPNNNNPSQQVGGNSNTDSGLGGGAIAGIVIGGVALVALLAVLVFMMNRFLRLRTNYGGMPSGGTSGFDNATYDQNSEKVNFSET